jgi:catechol 2,3-dioxygenase-like lactoylglutathione lyase family enzyme
MLLAVELHLRRTRGRERPCAKLHHQNTRRCIHCGAASGEEVLRSAERVARGSSRRKAAAVAALCLLLAAAAATARTVRATGPVGLTVSDLDRSVAFYTGVLGFEKVGERELSGPQHERLVGVFGAWVRVARLRLGEESIELTEYLAPRGRPAPADSRSNDRWFQHVAIVVSDLDRAVARLREHRVELASSGPQRLPDWNPKAGGIRAFYFRDPDRHPLEVIWFPPGKGAERWHRQGEQLFLGIDHTAIVVADTDASLAFYRDALGLTVAGESENWGIEQEHLNNVFGARLRITTLRAASGPGIELLEYLTPRDGRPMPADERASDLVHWETVLTASDLEGLAGRLADGDTAFVSPGLVRLPGSSPESAAVTVRDPDGHVLRIEGAGVATTANRAEEAQR